MEKVPHIPDDLLEFLNKLYPERCPDTGWSEREIWTRTGARLVVRKLLQMKHDEIQRSMLKE